MKSKKLIIYEVKSTGNLFVRATNDKFKIKPIKYGEPLPRNITDAELGRSVREILRNCD